jgi:hypothetical protein
MRIVPRTEVGLRSPLEKLASAPRQRAELFLHHSVTSVSGGAFTAWRLVQKAAFDRGFKDISYTWGVYTDGTVMEGRSVDAEGAHTEGYNRRAHAICLIGNYSVDQPTMQQVASVRWLRFYLPTVGILTPTHGFRPHRAVKATQCPGNHTYAIFSEFTKPWQPPVVPTPEPTPEPGDELILPPTIKQGDTGQHVRNLQSLLISHAEDICLFASGGRLQDWVDGSYGSVTADALRQWQERTQRLAADGVCGPATWRWLIGI